MSPAVISRRRRCGCRRCRGRTRALFVRPDDHLERMARARRRRRRAPRSPPSARQRPEIAVEVAAARHRVDVRAEEDRRQRRARCRARRAKMLPAGSMRGSSPAARHLRHHEAAAVDVGVGVCHAADAVGERAAGGTAEDAQLLDPLAEPGGVDAHVLCLRAQREARGADGRGRQACEKFTPGRVAHSSSAAALPPPDLATSSCLMRSTLNFAALAMILSSASSKSNDVAFEKRV